jgi:hypothetical protein
MAFISINIDTHQRYAARRTGYKATYLVHIIETGKREFIILKATKTV